MFKITHKKFAVLLCAIFAFFAFSLFAQDTTSNTPSAGEVTDAVKVVLGILSMFGIKVTGIWSALILLLVPVLWRWIEIRRLKRIIKHNAAVAAENKNLPAGHGEDPIHYKGSLFTRLFKLFKKK